MNGLSLPSYLASSRRLETPFIDLKIDPMPTAEQAGLLARGITDALVEVVGKRREVTAVRIDGSAVSSGP
jgi:hypothetical protein